MLVPQFTVLVIDEQPHVFDLVRQAAHTSFPEAHFIQINSLDAAKSYFEKLRGRGPSLVFLDIDAEENLDAFLFLGLLQKHPQWRLLPVVALSTSKNSALVNKAYQAGVLAFTQKPDSYANWQAYLNLTRIYWCQTVALPKISYGQID